MKFYIHTFGCQMNVRESETASGILQSLGYRPSLSPREASLILINTCCIRDLAERKAWAMIGAIKALKQSNPSLVVGVIGCMMAKRDTLDELNRRFPFVDFSLGTNSLHLLYDVLPSVRKGNKYYQASDGEPSLEFDLPVFHDTKPLAFVNIIHGCNNFCTYCIVPYVRGREKSRPMDSIVREVDQLVEQGYKEITLLGQNVNSYGKNIGEYSFADLLRRLGSTGISRIRFMTSHPKDLSDELILAMRDVSAVCKQIHLPVQSGSTDVLHAMNRRYSVEHYRTLIAKLRAEMPYCGITTDLIAGFPGEKEKDHCETLTLLKDVQFDAAYTFAFSPRSGTPAARMGNQVPEEIKKSRLQELIDCQSVCTAHVHQSLVGTKQSVLVEGISKRDSEAVTGRIDRGRTVNFKGSIDMIGQIIPVRIVKAKANSLFGEREEQFT